MSSSDSEDSDKGIRYNKTEPTKDDKCLQDCSKYDTFGPSLPPYLQNNPLNLEKSSVIGPALPPHFQKNPHNETKEDISQIIGTEPSPPLELESKIIGPALPPHLQKSQYDHISSSIEIPNQSIGPALPESLKQQLLETSQEQPDEEEEEESYGPMPVGASQSRAHLELEERALQMKIDMLKPAGEKEPTREEWMLELPSAKATNLGLGPRQFRTKEAPDLSDRSSWTDTPEDRIKKRETKNKEPLDIKKEAELRELRKRDKDQEAIVKKHKRSKESLVDIHTKKIKKKDDESSGERRPFSREVDLKVNRFDEAQKKAVLKKAQLLDTRFSAGDSKFL